MLIDRQRLDCRRVEDAYLQFATLRVCSWYPQHFDVGKLPLHSNTSNTLQQITSIYHGIFMEESLSKPEYVSLKVNFHQNSFFVPIHAYKFFVIMTSITKLINILYHKDSELYSIRWGYLVTIKCIMKVWMYTRFITIRCQGHMQGSSETSLNI